MAQNELKDRILGWCAQAGEIAAVQDREELGSEVALVLRLNRPEGMLLGVYKSASEDKIAVIHSLRFPAGSVKFGDGSPSLIAPSSLGEAVERIVEARFGSLTGASRQTSDGQEVTLTASVYVDGLSKNAFIMALHEVVRVRRVLDHLHTGDLAEISPVLPTSTAGESTPVVEDPAVMPDTTDGPPPDAGVIDVPVPGERVPEVPAPAAAPTPAPATAPAPAPAAAPAAQAPAQPVPVAVPAPVPQPSATPVAQPGPTPGMPAPWTPSHRVPPAGMDAWSVPDPTQRAIARIDGGVPIQVTETAGAWAHILCSNGWSGWVDHRILVPGPR